MALGDKNRSQNAIDYQGDMAQNDLNNLRTDSIVPQNQTLWNQYLVDKDRGTAQQDSLMGAYSNLLGMAPGMFAPSYGGYSNLASQGAGASFDPSYRSGLANSSNGYGEFSKIGGFSQNDINNFRARSSVPIRAVYANANSDIDRQARLSGGQGANYNATKSRLARELAISLGDASTNTEASLADLIRSGKLSGLSGLAGNSVAGQGLQNSIDSLNASTRLGALGGMTSNASSGLSAMLSGLGGLSNLYSSAPGTAALSSGNALNSSNQLLTLQGLQNALGLGRIGAQNQNSQIPGNFSQILGNISQALGLGGQVASAFTG